MIHWDQILTYAKNRNPEPDKRVEKTDAEWAQQLSPEQYQVTRKHGTERPFSGEYCGVFELAIYACVCCGALLFDAREKFESGTGWPSFTQPIQANAIKYIADHSYGMTRVETLCNTCDAHLGHVFPDGPQPSGLRYCMNSVALKKTDAPIQNTRKEIVIGGGCFWCTEAIFESFKGIISAESGYSGGTIPNPTYKQICTGNTGHAEVIKITYDPNIISLADILRLHFLTHDPTSLNRQGADVGTQYRSVIYYANEDEKKTAIKIMSEMKSEFTQPIVTEISPLGPYYKAEDYHQNYYELNKNQPYCAAVISPKLRKLKEKYKDKLKAE